ncbi:hypothetical protein EJB05_12632, partial [Eragrostis curvula]
MWSGAKEFTLLCLAPMVEDLHWRCDCGSDTDRFGVRWRLFNLTLSTTNLHRSQVSGDEDHDFGQQISKMIPVTNFHVLELRIKTEGHVYGAMVLHLLGMCTFVRSLRLKLREIEPQDTNRCSVKCSCDHPSNWRSLNISLTDLKDIETRGFKGEGHGIDLLKAVFRSATMLERTDVYFSSFASPSNNDCIEIYGISKAYPSMKCNIYHESD